MFSNICGHRNIIKRLESIIKTEKVSHSYIFSGASGIGKKETAYAFANALTGGNRADIVTVTNENYGIKDRASLSVETVKTARSEMYVKPYISEKKVYIFPNAETMKAGAQNALLKVMEEPPSYIVIILITENRDAILETVRSRSNEFYFSPLSENEILSWTKENELTVSEEIIKFCGGSIGYLKQLAEREDIKEIVNGIKECFGGLISKDRTYIYKAISMLTEADKETRELILNIIISSLEAVMLEKENGIIGKMSKTTASGITEAVFKAREAIGANCTSSMVFSELMLDIWRIING